MKKIEDAQIAQAVKDVEAGRVQRIAVPGQWRVFKDGDGKVVVERRSTAPETEVVDDDSLPAPKTL